MSKTTDAQDRIEKHFDKLSDEMYKMSDEMYKMFDEEFEKAGNGKAVFVRYKDRLFIETFLDKLIWFVAGIAIGIVICRCF